MNNLNQFVLRRTLLAGAACVGIGFAGAAFASSLSESEPQAKFAVGMTTNFVRDFSKPFDTWGRKYKTEEYKSWLDDVDASGTPRTTVTNIYYPTAMSNGTAAGRGETLLPSALPAAAEGTQISVADIFQGDQKFTEYTFQGFPGNEFAFQGLLVEGIYQAYEGAPVADGSFPLVIMVHGLGSSVHAWASAAEYLAAQGYVVVTVAMTSDSAASPVFHDPASLWAEGKSQEEIYAAYGLRSGNTDSTVFRNFFGFLYQYDGPLLFESLPDPSLLTPTPEGALRSGQLMADLFDQRIEDVARVIAEMKYLNAPEVECRVGLEVENSPEDLCGFFAGRIDVDNIGVMGHSLGSMTAQASAAFLEDVDTAVGFNNGMPRLWEPYGGFPGDPVDGRPAGVPKPFLQIIGSDDFFVHYVFRDIHGNLYRAAGGDPDDNYPLADEQPWPTDDNPQPVARSAYNRATDDKMLLMFRDQGHGHATDDEPGVFSPGYEHEGLRLPATPDGAPEPYRVLGWIKDGGMDVYLPHVMRHYFLTHWFDWTLKGDEQARAALLDHPYTNGVEQLLETGVSQ